MSKLILRIPLCLFIQNQNPCLYLSNDEHRQLTRMQTVTVFVGEHKWCEVENMDYGKRR